MYYTCNTCGEDVREGGEYIGDYAYHDKCMPSAKDIREMLRLLERRVDSIESQISGLQSTVSDIHDLIGDIKSTVTD